MCKTSHLPGEHLSRYRESARPFIVFPDEREENWNLEGWIQVAADLETMINHLIKEKAEKVVVQYVDRRIPGVTPEPRDFGLAVEAFRKHDPKLDLHREILTKVHELKGKLLPNVGLKGDEVLKCPMTFGPKIPMQIMSNDDASAARHHYQDGDNLCEICHQEIDAPIHIPRIE
jgi:hypothetical protein